MTRRILSENEMRTERFVSSVASGKINDARALLHLVRDEGDRHAFDKFVRTAKSGTIAAALSETEMCTADPKKLSQYPVHYQRGLSLFGEFERPVVGKDIDDALSLLREGFGNQPV